MATLIETVAFSPTGEYLAFSSPDGRLKLLETATGVLKQQYTPSSHLSSTCTCLSWNPTRHTSKSPKKKRRKQQSNDTSLGTITDSRFIAMGTTTGSVLIYSFEEGDLYTHLENGHSDSVNGVCWDTDSICLYSCSSDQHIVQWDINSSKVKHKWKADRHEVHSICLIDNNNLLSASGNIKWWNLSTRQVIKKFTGHATEVFRILPVRFQEQSDAEGSYFLSAAKDDRTINAWQLRENSDSNSLATFSALEELVHLDVSQNLSRDLPVYITALTQSGSLHIFEHQLNGKCKKPIQAKVTIYITSEGANGMQAKPLPILAAHVLHGQSRILIAYGSFISAAFEEISINECKTEEWLIRNDPAEAFNVTVQGQVSKVKKPDRPQSAKVLAPGHMTPLGPQVEQNTSLRKRKDSLSQNQLPMEERLNALKLEPNESGVRVPTADNLVHLLLQGLQSNNLQLLDSVLHRNEENTIRNTVRRLPLTAIIPLVGEIKKRLHGKGSGCPSYLRWLKCILVTHTSYLTSCQDADRLFGPVAQLLEGRSEAFLKMAQLRGRLNLMLSQLSSREESLGSTREALLVYNEESSEDEDPIEDIMGSPSDSEENWSDLDMDLDESQANNVDSSSEDED